MPVTVSLTPLVSPLPGSPDSLRGSLLVLGSSLEASLGKLQSQPSTSTCSPMKVKKLKVSLKAGSRVGGLGGRYGSGGRDLIPRKLSMSKMKKRDEGQEIGRVKARLLYLLSG